MKQNIEIKISVNDNSLDVIIDGKSIDNFDDLPIDIKLKIISELDLWQDRLYSCVLNKA